MSSAPLLLLAAFTLAAGPERLEHALTLLAQGQCSEASAAFADVSFAALTESGKELAGQQIAARITPCRKDAALALGLSTRALALAPKDLAVRIAHANSLVQSGEDDEARGLLNLILSDHRRDAPEARLLRGELAEKEGDHALAVRLLEPLEKDLQHGERARLTLAAARTGAIAHDEEVARTLAITAEKRSQAAQASATPGKVVEKLPGSLRLGGSTTLTAKGLTAGERYAFTAVGSCNKQSRNTRRRIHMKDPNGDIFGIDFRVQIDGAPTQILEVGKRHQESSRVPFTASGTTASIKIYDSSSVDSQVTCTVGEFAIVTQ